MNTLFCGKNFIQVDQLPSTNTSATELLPDRPAEGTVVLAMHQTAGRGQQGNSWQSAPGENLTFSLILYPTFLDSGRIFLLNKMVSCALRDLVQALLPREQVEIKWPNDLLVNRKKICGMLIENHLDGKRIGSTVIGIGLNVNQQEFPEELAGTATSLSSQTGKAYDLMGVLENLLARIEAGYLRLRAGRHEQVERQYLEHLLGYQELTLLRVKGAPAEPRMIVGVDQHGRLALEEGQKLAYYGIKEVEFCL